MPSSNPSEGNNDDDGLDANALFQEPDGYFQPEKPPSFAEYKLLNGETVKLRLVGHNPLWGHILWNAGQVLSEYLQENASTLVRGKTVLELGAGAGLPGIVCCVLGAQRVLITDYPDQDLVDNLRYNVEHIPQVVASSTEVFVEGYKWGAPLPSISSSTTSAFPQFDILILADLLFNHSEHTSLVRTVVKSLKQTEEAKALVFFTPHRPWLYEKDMAFFEETKKEGLAVEEVVRRDMEKVMFEEDPGDEGLRKMVFGFVVRWGEDVLGSREGS